MYETSVLSLSRIASWMILFAACGMLVACDSDGLSVSEPAEHEAAPLASDVVDAGQTLVTSDPVRFADAVRTIDNENEILVVLRGSGARATSASRLRNLQGNPIAAVPDAASQRTYRSRPGMAEAGPRANEAVRGALKRLGVVPYRGDGTSKVLALRLTDDQLEPVLEQLLTHPNVDYVEPNRRRTVRFDAGPIGSNGGDTKHSVHDVYGAWDHTRGAGAVVGIMDSGFAYDQATGSYHPDGQKLAHDEGIEARGFVDDFDSFGNCDGGDGQPYGNCLGWDDEGHGTSMTGLAGANDNSFGAVGIMPKGLTVSMKIAQNCYITNGCGGGDSFEIEDDDLYYGIEWATQNGVDVLSMSFSGGSYGLSVENAFHDAYTTHDVLLVSSTGNTSGGGSFPQSYSEVMGIGGINADGSNYGVNANEEVSGYAGGRTTNPYCPSTSDFCEPSGSGYTGGTSAATANTAAVAGLVRSYTPSISASALRQRLKDTADQGERYRVRAEAAVLNDLQLRTFIYGPVSQQAGVQGSWSADADGVQGGLTFRWYVDGSLVRTHSGGTEDYYSKTPYSDFTLRVEITDGSGETDSASRTVDVWDPCTYDAPSDDATTYIQPC